MRRAIIVLLPLAGCRPGLATCENAIKAKLKAPATYQRVAQTPGEYRYEIDFDAANAFGTPMRDRATCTLTPEGAATVRLRSDTADARPEAGF